MMAIGFNYRNYVGWNETRLEVYVLYKFSNGLNIGVLDWFCDEFDHIILNRFTGKFSCVVLMWFRFEFVFGFL
jgi:hypothetical protein